MTDDKFGLAYFSLDVDIFSDTKVKHVAARFEEKGELIVIKLLAQLYRSGYAMKWDSDEEVLFAQGAGKNITPELVHEIVEELLKRDFFDRSQLETYGHLTGTGAQKRWKKAIKALKRDLVIPEEHNLQRLILEKSPKFRNDSGKNGKIPEEVAKIPEETAHRKERKEKIEKKGDEESASPPGIDFEKMLLADQQFVESICITNKISEKEFTGAATEFFTMKKNLAENTWPDYADCKRNFLFWLPGFFSRKNGNGKYKQEPEVMVHTPQAKYETVIDFREIVNTMDWTILIAEDVEKLKANPNFKPMLSTRKLDWLREKQIFNPPKEQRELWKKEAEAQFIRELHERCEEVSVRSQIAQYKKTERFTPEQQDKIKVIAKELAYAEYLNGEISAVESFKEKTLNGTK